MADKVKKIKGLSINPELMKLAEDEIAIKFMEQPGMVEEVKEKVADLTQSSQGRQLIESRDAIKYLRKNLGAELAAIMCSVDEAVFSAFGRARSPRKPSRVQGHNIATSYVILDILLSQLSRQQAIDWLTTYSDYLYGVPAIEIHRRPEDVRMAALNRVMGGDDTVSVL